MLDSCNVEMVVDSLQQVPMIPELNTATLKTYVTDALNNNEFFQGGMVLAILGWIGMQLRSVPATIWGWGKKFFIYEALIDQQLDGELYESFNDWYRVQYPEKYRRVQMYMPGKWDETLNRTTYDIKKYQEEDTNFVWRHWRGIFIKKHRIRLENANNINNLYYNEYRIRGLFARKAIDAMLAEIKDELNSKAISEKGIKVFSIGSSSGYEKVSSQRIYCYKTFNDLFFDKKDELIEFVEKHNAKREHSRSKGIKHKTGIRLHGPPGTGKTSIILALAHHFKMNVAPINLANFATDEEFIAYIKELPPNTVIAFEDIDDYMGGTKRGGSANDRSYVSFSTLLQILDGIISPENVIFVLTTNKPKSLDPAMYRDGRIDLDLEIPRSSWTRICEYVAHYFDRTKEETYDRIRVPDYEAKPGLSMSTVERCCISSTDPTEAFDKIFIEKEKVTTNES